MPSKRRPANFAHRLSRLPQGSNDCGAALAEVNAFGRAMDSKSSAQHTSLLPLGRRLPVGGEPLPGCGVHFRVWAPAAREVAVELDGGAIWPLAPQADGYFAGLVAEAAAGMRYRYRLDGGERV